MKKQILTLVNSAIKAQLLDHKIPSKAHIIKNYPDFDTNRATFVTLKINGNLRGCIGSLSAYRNLYDDLVENSIGAAFKDPRFMPLSKEEFLKTSIEVSLLSEASLLEYKNVEDLKSKVEVGTDGIILKLGARQATFLPQVWEQLDDFDSFFAHLCNKAGLDANSLELHPMIYKYQVEKIRENEIL